ncbi:MAG: 50S ribosomal protein L20 [Alphaproteobacteria bacterium]|nr:MAG: 50S ribosomal protein L20 [Alphaproteobacteria bacterium]
MTRQKRGVTKRKTHKKFLAYASGFRGRSSTCYRIARNRVEKAWQHAYDHRKQKTREFRSLFIQRISAAVRSMGLNYSRFMNLVSKAGLELNRKVLSQMAILEPETFKNLVNSLTKA